MATTSLNRICCGGEADWWPSLCRGTQALIEGEASLALLPAAPNDSTSHAFDQIAKLSQPPVDEPCLLILTSGSVGKAKVVILTRENLLAANQLANERLGETGSSWICALPPDHIAGYLTVFRSLANTNGVHLALDESGCFDALRLKELLPSVGSATALSLVWRQLNGLLSQGLGPELARLRAVLVGGGPSDSATEQMALASSVNVISTYGMTESCGGVVWGGTALSGTRIEIDAAPGQIGVITVIGPTVAYGYLGAEVFTDERFRTHDLGLIDQTGSLQVMGRDDDVVIVNGYNVSLGAVELTVGQMPGVEEVGAVTQDQGDGNRLFIAVAPVTSESPDLAQVRAFLARSLGRGALPADVVAVAKLPIGRGGKVDRAALLKLFQS